MSMCDSATLEIWRVKYSNNKRDLSSFGLNYAFDLTAFAFDSGLLAHMRTRWNPATTTFHIGGRQICPTVEEFAAILHIDEPYQLGLPPLSGSISFAAVCQQLIGCSKPMAKTIFNDQKIDLMGWSTIMFNKDRRIPITDQAWRITVVTVFLSHYFLAPSNGKPSAKVFEVAHTLSTQPQDIYGLILVETLIGLNEPARSGEMSPRGSPLTLYIWLMEKLSFLPPVPSGQLTDRQSLDRIRNAVSQSSVTNDVPIRDVMPWYKIKKMMHNLDDMPLVTIHGLERDVSYITSQLYGQFGRKSMPDTTMPPHLFNGPISAEMHKYYLKQLSKTIRISIEEKVPDLEDYLARPNDDRVGDRSNSNGKRPSTSNSASTQQQKKKKK